MNYPLHCTVTYNNLLGRLYRGMRAVAEDALPSRICLRGGCHKCHISHIGNEKLKKSTFYSTFRAFFKEIENYTPYLYGLNQCFGK